MGRAWDDLGFRAVDSRGTTTDLDALTATSISLAAASEATPVTACIYFTGFSRAAR